MLDITIFEGSRGCGKSTIARMMRDKISESTLINPTGFHADGEIGKEKVTNYYDSWMRFLDDMQEHDSNIIFDRFYFSERVYSLLYKHYRFTDYERFNHQLWDLAFSGVNVNIFFLYNTNKEEISTRLIRDKVPFATAEESVEESLGQQKIYSALFEEYSKDFAYQNSPIKLHYINTEGISAEDIYNEILQLKATY